MNYRLKHLIVVPSGGMCNRLQGISSGIRLCNLLGIQCTVVWNWGQFEDFFQPTPGVSYVPSLETAKPTRKVKTLIHAFDPSYYRKIKPNAETIIVHTNSWFWGNWETLEHDYRFHTSAISPFIPKPTQVLQNSIDSFAKCDLPQSVGLHIRRTDHATAIRFSPDNSFIACADEAIAKGRKVFLSTDNLVTEKLFKTRYGEHLLMATKTNSLPIRWPRQFSAAETTDDLRDLLLLSQTGYVIGSYGSTFSEIAILLNGSKHSRVICVDTKKPTIASKAVYRIKAASPLLRKLIDWRWRIYRRRAIYYKGIWLNKVRGLLKSGRAGGNRK